MFKTEQEIEDQITREDREPYLEKVYDGFVPQLFPEYFRKALMFVPITAHRYNLEVVKGIISKRPSEYTNKEVGMMINLIYGVAWAQLHPNLETAIEITEEFNKIRDEYNKRSEEMEIKCAKKKITLMNINGHNQKRTTRMGIIHQ